MNSAVRNTLKLLVVTAVFTVAILLGGFYSTASSLVAQPGLIEGVSVDGIDLSGLSDEAARQMVREDWERRMQGVGIPVTAGDVSYTFTMEDAGARLVMDEAFEQLSYLKDGDVMDQLSTRLQSKGGYSYQTTTEFDEASLALAVEKFAQQVNVPPVNATVQFGEDGEFIFTDALPGRMLEEDELLRTLLEKYRSGDYAPIEAVTVEVAPTLTKEELEKHTDSMGNTRTAFDGTQERLTNIRLLAEAVNGKTIMPGEVLSLNALGAAGNGDADQLAATMYSAALLSELEIVERHQSEATPAYLAEGLGVAMGEGRDLKLRNNTGHPVYVRAQADEAGVAVSFFGQAQTKDLRIELECEVTQTVKPPAAQTSYDDTKAAGYRRVVEAARDGSVVTTYRCYYDGDTLIKREEIAQDRYEPVQGRVIVGSRVDVPRI